MEVVEGSSIYRKVPKFKQTDHILGYFVKKMQMELQIMKTLIKLLLKEQSALGLHCLPRPISPKTYDHYGNPIN